MRRLIPAALFIFALTLAAGCKAPEHPAGPTEHSPDLRELGRPWPVEVGRFAAPFRFLGHDASGILFAAGRPATRYRVDYRLRRLVRLGYPRRQENEEPRIIVAEAEEGRASLVLVRPDGTRLVVTGSLLGAAWAQTEDRRALAFYEAGPEGAQLVYCEPLAGIRAVWCRLEVPPAAAALTWSEEGSYLAEEHDGVLTVFARADGTPRWSAAGTAASFAPGERYLLYRQGEELRLLDLSRWYARALPAPGGGRLLSSAWSPDGERVFYLYESTATGEAARFLYLYEVESGVWQRHPVPGTLDPLAASAFLHLRPAEVGPLLALLPRLNEGTLCHLGEGFYLAGLGRELVLLDLSAKSVDPKPLYRFPGRVSSLSPTGRRLALVSEDEEGLRLYAWNLPASAALTGIFPDRRDLTLGPLTLGMDAAEIRAALGAPLEVEKHPDPFEERRLLLTYFYPEAAVTIARGRVERIIYSGPGVSTPRGVTVGTSRAEVLARYGRPDYELRDYLAYRGRVDGLSVKVAFKFDGEGRVAAILLAQEGNLGGKIN